MAWSAPPAFTVSQVVTAAQVNILSDNLKYLKGQAGAVAIEDALMIGASTSPSYRAQITNSDATATKTGAVGAELAVENTQNGGIRYAGIRFRTNDSGAGGVIRSAGRVLGSFAAGTFSDSQLILQTADGSETFRDVMTLRGANVGIGTTGPQGPLHLQSAASGGAIFFGSDTVAGTAVSVLPSGMTKAGTLVATAISTDLAVTGSNAGTFVAVPGAGNNDYNIVNSGADIMVLRVASTGAVTLIRTGGAKTYRVSLWLLYL